MKNTKGQFIVVSVLFLLLLLLVIYSLGTQKPYIAYSGERHVLNNLLEEGCTLGNLSNGSYLDYRFSDFINHTTSYCSGLGYTCTFNISRPQSGPSYEDNLSQLSYLNFTYSLYFKGNVLTYNSSFTC